MDRGRVIITLAALAAAGGCSRDKDRSAASPTRLAVASIATKYGDVSHRKAQTIAWHEAEVGASLYHRDAVKTAAAASARVSFTAGGTLQIGERALVVIEEPPAPPDSTPKGSGAKQGDKAKRTSMPVARVQKGVVRGVLEPGAAPMKVVTPSGQEAQIAAEGDKAATFRVEVKEGGKLEVAVLKGNAKVKIGSSTRHLSDGQVVDVKGRQVSKPVVLLSYPELAAPEVDAKLHAGTRLQLKWKPVQGATLYRVQVSHSVGFEARAVDARVTVSSYVLPELEAPKTYVWRVSSIDAAGHVGEFGFARRFHILSAKKAESGLLSPPDNAGVQYVKEVKPITFRWKGEGTTFQLIVARDRALRRRVVVRSSKEHSTVVRNLRRGTYYWGVYAVTKGQKRALFTKPHRLMIAKRLPPGVQVPRSVGWQ